MQFDADYLAAWLRLFGSHVPAVRRAALVVRSDGAVRRFDWPESGDASDELYRTADLAMRTGKDITSTATVPTAEAMADAAIVAAPLTTADGRRGGVAALLEAPATQRATAMHLLKWATGWLAEMPVAAPGAVLASLLDQLSAAAGARTVETAAAACATSLAEYLNCERVVIGHWRGDRFELTAISHGSALDRGSDVAQHLSAALATCDHVEAVVLIGRDGEPPDVRVAALDAMARAQRREYCLVPLTSHNTSQAGLVLLERARERPFSAEMVELYGGLGRMVAVVLSAVRWSTGKRLPGLDWTWHGLRRGHRLAIVAAAGVALTALLAVAGPSNYRVVEAARIEGKVQRVVVAPFDGYIKAAHFRAGDMVESGAALAELETRELLLDRRHWIDKRSEFEKQHRKALATLDRAAVTIHSAQIDQAEAQVRLIDLQIDRAELAAPLTGVIIAGDLSQSLGAPVERGQILFEVAPLGAFRLAIYVDQDEVSLVQLGQTGTLALKAFPANEFPIVVREVSPDFEERNYSVRYRVEASIDPGAMTLLPGMQGVARISVGDRSYAGIYFSKLTSAVRLWTWMWLP
ncbi:MAG: HlyD family efflux transporter periplasmic adaptor subunit [Alphaproteobacteria bacterium]